MGKKGKQKKAANMLESTDPGACKVSLLKEIS